MYVTLFCGSAYEHAILIFSDKNPAIDNNKIDIYKYDFIKIKNGSGTMISFVIPYGKNDTIYIRKRESLDEIFRFSKEPVDTNTYKKEIILLQDEKLTPDIKSIYSNRYKFKFINYGDSLITYWDNGKCDYVINNNYSGLSLYHETERADLYMFYIDASNKTEILEPMSVIGDRKCVVLNR